MSDKPLHLLLGFDYGSKQIGVAVGQVITGHARELCVLKAQNGVPDWSRVEALIKEWQPDAVVVGLPLNMDGTPSEMSARAEKFARRLNGRFNLPTYTHDERLTTFEAKGQRLREGQSGGYRARPVDAIAAALLLQGAMTHWASSTCPSTATTSPKTVCTRRCSRPSCRSRSKASTWC